MGSVGSVSDVLIFESMLLKTLPIAGWGIASELCTRKCIGEPL